jgi:predicted PurR-regulated permease PerM
MIAAIDNWVPPARRETVRPLAREMDDTIGGFARGQGALCLVLAIYYSAALTLMGLEHGALIGIAAGLISFIPVDSRDRDVAAQGGTPLNTITALQLNV